MSDLPLISVIIPVHNGATCLGRAIAAIRAGTFQDYELIVVDDASTDTTADLLATHAPDVHLHLPENAGPYACRNLGASYARGALLFFTDADVTLAPDTLARVADHWREHGRRCVIGTYTLEHPNRDVWSTYKNSWIRFTYERAPRHVDWFFTAVGMIHRDLWELHRGFEGALANDQMGDLEFGRVLAAAGVPIYRDDALGVTHSKRFTARGLLRNQRIRAAAGLYGAAKLRVLGDVPRTGYANASRGFILGTVLAPWLPVLVASGAITPWALVPAALAALAWAGTVAPFVAWSARHLGIGRAAAFVVISWLDHVACAIGLAQGATWVGAELARGGIALRRAHPRVEYRLMGTEPLPQSRTFTGLDEAPQPVRAR